MPEAFDRTPISAGIRRDHHRRAWVRSHLKVGSEIWRLADDRLFLGRTRTDQIADHNEVGRDAHRHLQGRTGIRGELWNP
jgi:hypothetical protein